jgi:hypothetical protein
MRDHTLPAERVALRQTARVMRGELQLGEIQRQLEDVAQHLSDLADLCRALAGAVKIARLDVNR